ncbi:uncharacterized protein MKK02DRAFT_42729 [Dioszegia hungarica]|uniref:Chromo domain-containing protein n=1 Tax=Dioszegia hungarica TaxID=4972 RepID=A0AA38HDK4_9TREE|nr:uncharacterized protein MKK02DRAFT_42729 [Dioszegia hungarica]KAI9638343.1 hypothetical protein MKK02DRAFT_42729 [Dioszegia hungarica]
MDIQHLEVGHDVILADTKLLIVSRIKQSQSIAATIGEAERILANLTIRLGGTVHQQHLSVVTGLNAACDDLSGPLDHHLAALLSQKAVIDDLEPSMPTATIANAKDESPGSPSTSTRQSDPSSSASSIESKFAESPVSFSNPSKSLPSVNVSTHLPCPPLPSSSSWSQMIKRSDAADIPVQVTGEYSHTLPGGSPSPLRPPRSARRAKRGPEETDDLPPAKRSKSPPRQSASTENSLLPTTADEEDEQSTGVRRSTRTQLRPKDYFEFMEPTHPSYISLQEARGGAKRPKAPVIAGVVKEGHLRQSSGLIRPGAFKARWPECAKKTSHGKLLIVTCDKCGGRCHAACAGFTPDEYSREEWTCPDCRYLAETGGDKLHVAESDLGACIRPDCILLPKRSLREQRAIDECDEGSGDEAEDVPPYVVTRFIGRRRGSAYSVTNKLLEYLVMWKGEEGDPERLWGVEDATWETRQNLETVWEEMDAPFAAACLAEGIDHRLDQPKPILLQEARGIWNEEGELRGDVDGWSKREWERLMAEAAQKAEEAARKKKKGRSVTSRK